MSQHTLFSLSLYIILGVAGSSSNLPVRNAHASFATQARPKFVGFPLLLPPKLHSAVLFLQGTEAMSRSGSYKRSQPQTTQARYAVPCRSCCCRRLRHRLLLITLLLNAAAAAAAVPRPLLAAAQGCGHARWLAPIAELAG